MQWRSKREKKYAIAIMLLLSAYFNSNHMFEQLQRLLDASRSVMSWHLILFMEVQNCMLFLDFRYN